MKSNIDLDRRKVLGTVGGLALAGSGMAAFTGSAAADGDASLSDANAAAVTTDDGEINYVAYGGVLKYEWDGLDTPAAWGEYVLEARLISDKFDGGSTGWRYIGSDAGELGSNWGGDNDPDSGKGTEGFFTFRYGSGFGQRDYAIAYSDEVASDPDAYGVITVPADKAFNLNAFEEPDDGDAQNTTLRLRYTCRVYDGDPSNGGSVIGVPDKAQGNMPVKVTNRPATGTTGGQINSSVGADES